jgi:RimJ/RimL family protein N-acetyltransferase
VTEPRPEIAWPLTTERLVLRPATAEDAPAVFRHRRLPEVARWLTAAPEDVAAFAERLTRPENLGPTVVVELDGTIVGDLLLRVEDGWGQLEVAADAARTQAEIGWAFHPEVGGRGLATEAVRRLVEACFAELGLRRVTAVCFADNAPSWRLMERIGMRREGAFRADSLHRDGRWLDSYAYGLLREEWARAAEVQERL